MGEVSRLLHNDVSKKDDRSKAVKQIITPLNEKKVVEAKRVQNTLINTIKEKEQEQQKYRTSIRIPEPEEPK